MSSNPINTIEDLDAIRTDLTADYHLMRDLDFNDDGSYADPLNKPTYTTGDGWDPIATGGAPFTGTLEGNGYSIANLYINRTSDYVGLFGATRNLIQNLTLVTPSVTGRDHVGALVGRAEGHSSHPTSTDLYYCHIVGGSVDGRTQVGGLIGYIIYCRYIRYCSVVGVTVVGTGDEVGGLIGRQAANYELVSFCSADCDVTGVSEVGGFIGRLHSQNEGITNSRSLSKVHASGQDVGGFVGYNYRQRIEKCFSAGLVTSGTGTDVGGFCGRKNTSGSYADVHNLWDMESSGQATSEMGTGITTTAEAQTITPYSNASWSIVAVTAGITDTAYTWNIVEAESYPFLSWQENPVLGSPEIDSIEVLSPWQLRVTFSMDVEPNSALFSVGNYEIEPEGQAHSIEVDSSDSILINTRELVDSEAYQLTIHRIDGVGGLLEDITPSSLNAFQIQIEFPDAIEDNPAVYNPDNYAVEPFLEVKEVEMTSSTTIVLTTSEQVEGESYQVTIYRLGPSE